jgi:DNA-directed RNA polymerase specialized sigma24 family protein
VSRRPKKPPKKDGWGQDCPPPTNARPASSSTDAGGISTERFRRERKCSVSDIDAIGGRRAFQRLVLEAPLMIAKVPMKNDAADLYWLAFLLTGSRDVSIDIAVDATASHEDMVPFFVAWMESWSRRIVIAKALAAVRQELAESARRTERARVHQSTAPPRGWSLPRDTTKTEIEEALLAIDLFPRAAVLLLIFEGLRIADVATLLDADVTLVKKGQAIGLRELTSNLAGKNDHARPSFFPALCFAQATH